MRMRSPLVPFLLGLQCVALFASGQTGQPVFEVASVRPSQHEVGPDYNNQFDVSVSEFNGRNVTLKRLIAEAWHCQINQVLGPPWIDRSEYDVAARIPEGDGEQQIPLMLRSLLISRFNLKEHEDARQMRIYRLTVSPGGLKVHPEGQGTAEAAGAGLPFRGTMRQFADLLAVQFSIPASDNPSEPSRSGGPTIPVLDQTGLQGVYNFRVDIRPELGTDAFTAWKRALSEQLGLEIESRKAAVTVIVVDDVAKVPTRN